MFLPHPNWLLAKNLSNFVTLSWKLDNYINISVEEQESWDTAFLVNNTQKCTLRMSKTKSLGALVRVTQIVEIEGN